MVSRIRLIVQVACFVLLVWVGLLGVRRITVAEREPSFPTLSCEYGRPIAKCFLYDLQYLLTSDASAHYRRLVEPVLFFLGLGLLLGRTWCGWVCPLGLVQDLITRARVALGRRPIRLGETWRWRLYWSAWGLLVVTMALSAVIGWPSSKLYAYRNALMRPYCQLCPSKQLSPLLTGNLGGFLHIDRFDGVSIAMSLLGIVVFAGFLVGAFAIRRFWCRLCAMGLLMEATRLNRWSLVNLRKDIRRCTRCGNCARVCPVDIQEVYLERERTDVSPTECQLCLRCAESCPESGVLSGRFLKWAFYTSKEEQAEGQGPKDQGTERQDPREELR
jgi:ferredoxin-type protein NapH